MITTFANEHKKMSAGRNTFQKLLTKEKQFISVKEGRELSFLDNMFQYLMEGTQMKVLVKMMVVVGIFVDKL